MANRLSYEQAAAHTLLEVLSAYEVDSAHEKIVSSEAQAINAANTTVYRWRAEERRSGQKRQRLDDEARYALIQTLSLDFLHRFAFDPTHLHPVEDKYDWLLEQLDEPDWHWPEAVLKVKTASSK